MIDLNGINGRKWVEEIMAIPCHGILAIINHVSEYPLMT